VASRRKARRFALQVLYQLDLLDVSSSEVLGDFWSDDRAAAAEKGFAEELVRGVETHRRELDRLLEESSTRWRVQRMPLVDRNILRLGVYELWHRPDIPISVSLNEAIELGKAFGGPEAAGFINGVLDRIARRLPADAKDLEEGVHPPMAWAEEETPEDYLDPADMAAEEDAP